jgi:glycosyltransferase involved in cell wall biosynthesis
MADQPLVSAITIFLNAERFIEEAIESVFAQTYRRWELLLVDDGSTDGSTATARRYAAAHPDRVRYLEHANHENRGMSAARNLGIRHARGTYIAFLDSDDVWLPEKLAQQVPLLEAHPEVGMLMGASLYWYSWTGRPEDAGRDVLMPVGAPQDQVIEPPLLLTKLYPLGLGAAPCNGSLLVRRRSIEGVNGFEERFRGMYEDQAFLVKLYLATSVYITGRCLDRYRQHADSCSAGSALSGNYRTVREEFLTWFEVYLRARDAVDARVWRALEHSWRMHRHPVLDYVRRRRPAVVLRALKRNLGRAWSAP